MAKTPKTSASAIHRGGDRTKARASTAQEPDLTYGRIDPQGLPRSVYVPTTVEEYQFIGTVLANGWKAGKSVLDYYRKADSRTALAVSVMRSEGTPQGYRLDFQFANLSPHSLYIEELFILDPDADAYQIRLATLSLHDTAMLDKRQVGPSMSFDDRTAGTPGGSAGESARSLPILLKPGDKPAVSMMVQPDAKLWFDTAKVGIARATVSFLSEESNQSVAWRFRIRDK